MSVPRVLTGAAVVLFGSAVWLGRAARKTPIRAPLEPVRPGTTLRDVFETFPESVGSAQLRLYSDNAEAWVARWRLLAGARTSLDISYFILHEDEFGLSFLGHVLERAQAGVQVRILLDALGTKMSREFAGNGFLEELAALPNVSICTYRPLWRRWTEALLTLQPSALVASEHDKIIIVDGCRSLIGGRNIATEYFVDPHEESDAFHDLDLRIDSAPVAGALMRAFESQCESEDAVAASGSTDDQRRPALSRACKAMDDWLRGRMPEPAVREVDKLWLDALQKRSGLRGALDKPEPEPVRAETRILDSQARFHSPDDPITQALGRLVQAASQEIFAQTPYLVLSEAGLNLLEDASKRGVKITFLTNSPASSDNALSQAFFLETWPEILERVPTLRLFVAGCVHNRHAKAVTFDGELALVGTYNLDPVSMAFNSEVMAASWSAEQAHLTELPARRAIERGAPGIFEYRIERAADGSAVRDDEGKVVVAFGPRDHCSPDEWTSLNAYWSVLRAAKDFVGFSPFL